MLLSYLAIRWEKRIHVKGDLCWPGKSQIAHEILAYLAEHPEAQDTLDGIVQWWLLEQKIRYQTNMVKEVLVQLVSEGLVIEHKSRDSRTHYRTNQSKSEEIRKLLNNRPE